MLVRIPCGVLDQAIGSTIDMAYEEVIASFMRSAQDRIDIAEAISTQTIEILKTLGRRNEEAKRKVLFSSHKSHSQMPNTLMG